MTYLLICVTINVSKRKICHSFWVHLLTHWINFFWVFVTILGCHDVWWWCWIARLLGANTKWWKRGKSSDPYKHRTFNQHRKTGANQEECHPPSSFYSMQRPERGLDCGNYGWKTLYSLPCVRREGENRGKTLSEEAHKFFPQQVFPFLAMSALPHFRNPT